MNISKFIPSIEKYHLIKTVITSKIKQFTNNTITSILEKTIITINNIFAKIIDPRLGDINYEAIADCGKFTNPTISEAFQFMINDIINEFPDLPHDKLLEKLYATLSHPYSPIKLMMYALVERCIVLYRVNNKFRILWDKAFLSKFNATIEKKVIQIWYKRFLSDLDMGIYNTVNETKPFQPKQIQIEEVKTYDENVSIMGIPDSD